MDDITGLRIAEALLDFGGIDPEVAVEKAGAGLDGEGGQVGGEGRVGLSDGRALGGTDE